MFNSVALGVVIGLIFVYLLYSLLGTIVQEIIATNIGLRGNILKTAIRRMLNDAGKDGLCDAFYKHPLIKYLSSGTLFLKKKPSYIKNETFSKVLIDLLRGQDAKPGDSAKEPIQQSLDKKMIQCANNVSIEDETLSYLKSIWADAQGDVQKFKAMLEQWFDEMMDRTTGWYKKYTQLILLGVGLTIAVIFNVDTIKIIQKLESDPKLREQLIAQADAFVKAHPNLEAELQKTKQQIDSLKFSKNPAEDSLKKDSLKKQSDSAYIAGKKLSDSLYKQASQLVTNDIKNVNEMLAIGWDGGFCKNTNGYSFFGWLLTALAISLGAPFWFDLLNKIMQLRSSVAASSNTDKTKAKDSSKEIKRVG